MLDLLQVPVYPVFRSTATDFLNNLIPRHGSAFMHCRDIELDALECLEAYGVRRGARLCDSYVLDYQECAKEFMQNQRNFQMKRERIRQILRGERKFSDGYDPIQPPRDSFQRGPFYN